MIIHVVRISKSPITPECIAKRLQSPTLLKKTGSSYNPRKQQNFVSGTFYLYPWPSVNLLCDLEKVLDSCMNII